MKMIQIVVGWLLLFSLTHAQQLSVDTIRNEITQSVQTHLKGPNQSLVRALYQRNDFRPLWFGPGNEEKTSQLIQALHDPLFNYKNKPFNQQAIKHLFYLLDNNLIPPSKQAKTYARLDLLLSNAYLHLVRFVRVGDVNWTMVQEKMAHLKESDDITAVWEMHPKTMPPLSEISQAIIGGDIYGYLEQLLPLERRYRELVDMLIDYRRMEKFPKIPYRRKVYKLGDKSKDIILIKKRLQITGDYPSDAPINQHFDLALKRALITYQKRYLLQPNGMVDPRVTYYLNQPTTKHTQAIITNLDKTKLYPKVFEEEYVEVNVPDFNLRYYKHGIRLIKMGVVVGRIDRPTPIFDNTIRYMVLNPTWTIPDNLIKRDLIHVIREHPDYLETHNIHVFQGNKEINVTQAMLDPYEHSQKHVPYRFVQFPGENNALGRVKFMFPNKYSVYLHDTNNKALLQQRYKIYSSGCMRVEKPFQLLDILLEHTKRPYTPEEIEAIFESNEAKTISLKDPVPVHIVYFTVYRENGLAYFKNDIYLYDQIIYESSQGHTKPTFALPKKRIIRVKKRTPQDRLSN